MGGSWRFAGDPGAGPSGMAGGVEGPVGERLERLLRLLPDRPPAVESAAALTALNRVVAYLED